MSASAKCPICESQVQGRDADFDHLYDCPRCGRFRIARTTEDDLSAMARKIRFWRPILSHAVRRMQSPPNWVPLTAESIEKILQEDRLPTPQRQADNALIWLGENITTADERSSIQPDVFTAIIGAADDHGVHFIVNHLVSEGLVTAKSWGSISGGKPIGGLGLTFKGWTAFEALRKTQSDSSSAFMAMAFGNQALTNIFRSHFKPAVKQTGYDLHRLDDNQSAGLIDNRLRVEIQIAKFLIADLSDHNNGAYWEAGYAEGLGKPVFYTCDKRIFEKEKSHFDTEHHLTIQWDLNNPQNAADELKAAVRATLRGEAKLQDT